MVMRTSVGWGPPVKGCTETSSRPLEGNEEWEREECEKEREESEREDCEGRNPRGRDERRRSKE